MFLFLIAVSAVLLVSFPAYRPRQAAMQELFIQRYIILKIGVQLFMSKASISHIL